MNTQYTTIFHHVFNENVFLQILKDLRDNKIRIFEFQEVAGEDEDYVAQHKSSKVT